MTNQRRTTISTLRYYAIGCVFVFSDDVLITMRSPERPRARRYAPEQTDNADRQLGIKNTRQVTPWGFLPGGRNLPRFFLWIGTDNHRRTPVKMSGRLGDRGDAGNAVFVKDQVFCGADGAGVLRPNQDKRLIYYLYIQQDVAAVLKLLPYLVDHLETSKRCFTH